MFKPQDSTLIRHIKQYNQLYKAIRELNEFTEDYIKTDDTVKRYQQEIAKKIEQLNSEYKLNITSKNKEKVCEIVSNAISSKHKELSTTYKNIEKTLKDGENPNTPSKENYFPLDLVEDTTLIQLLLAHGANLNLQSYHHKGQRLGFNKITPMARAFVQQNYTKALFLASSTSSCEMTTDTISSSLKFMAKSLDYLTEQYVAFKCVEPRPTIKSLLKNYVAELEIVDVLLNKANSQILFELSKELKTILLNNIHIIPKISSDSRDYQCVKILMSLDLILKVNSKITEKYFVPLFFVLNNQTWNFPGDIILFLKNMIILLNKEIELPIFDIAYFRDEYQQICGQELNTEMSQRDLLLHIIQNTMNEVDVSLLKAFKSTLYKFIDFAEPTQMPFQFVHFD